MTEIPDEVIRSVIVDCIVKKMGEHADGSPIDVVRELAKRPEIKLMWSVAKSNRVPFFEGTVSTWNSLQKRLVYWLTFYSNIEGAYERPPTRILENDLLLDKWVRQKAKESNEKYESDWGKGSRKIAKSAYDQDEVYEL